MVQLVTIDLDEERAARDRLLNEWRKAKAAKDAAVVAAFQTHSSPGDGYWQAEAKARARWVVAANFVEMLEEGIRARKIESAERSNARSGAGQVDVGNTSVGGQEVRQCLEGRQHQEPAPAG